MAGLEALLAAAQQIQPSSKEEEEEEEAVLAAMLAWAQKMNRPTAAAGRIPNHAIKLCVLSNVQQCQQSSLLLHFASA
jgi:hypothetical protein